MVTCGTLHKQRFFNTDADLEMVRTVLFDVAAKYKWALDAWSLFPNHYHWVGHAPEDAETLKSMLQELHSKTAIELNRQDSQPEREVWFQYWDICLTYEKSYFARLNYVHNNSVKHGFVRVAEDYPFCSARWFRQNANPSYFRRVCSYGYSRVNVKDDF